jgi:hypothetical protein
MRSAARKGTVRASVGEKFLVETFGARVGPAECSMDTLRECIS